MSGAIAATPRLDLRGLNPPEPMRLALEAVELLRPGATLEVVTDREPLLLHRELQQRKHSFVSDARPDGYHTTVHRQAENLP